ncbi:hypothetical protein Tco_0802272 [Tanacetum coccineum]|uniref:Uncharacterized protein n=1 Tax=Tanacetum coccineum TaxID=301880 RepID=A0ABQ4ZYD9_9ASTR
MKALMSLRNSFLRRLRQYHEMQTVEDLEGDDLLRQDAEMEAIVFTQFEESASLCDCCYLPKPLLKISLTNNNCLRASSSNTRNPNNHSRRTGGIIQRRKFTSNTEENSHTAYVSRGSLLGHEFSKRILVMSKGLFELHLRQYSHFNSKLDEAGVILTDEQNDFLFADTSRMEEIEELSANICLMTRIQPANHTSNDGPSYESAFIIEKLARNAYHEAEKQRIFTQQVQTQNTHLTSQLEMYKERVRILENINKDNNYLNEFLEADKRAKWYNKQAQSQLVRDRDIIRDLEKQRDKLDLDVKNYKRKNEELQKTHSILKRQMSEKRILIMILL